MSGMLSRAGLRFRAAARARGYATQPQQTANAALETAQKYASKAYEQAQSGAGKAFETAKNLSGSTGERVAGLLGSYRQPLVYNFQVAKELLKQVYIAERLAPPKSISEFQNVYKSFFNEASSLQYWRQLWTSGQWTKFSIYALEAYGIFHIGEMIGRRSIVGYKLK